MMPSRKDQSPRHHLLRPAAVTPKYQCNTVHQRIRSLVPKLTYELSKGEGGGRICVFGGCVMYAGAPFFAALAALKTGADLVHVMCEQDAGQVIKSYSPELIVHPVLDTEYVLEEIDYWLPRFHAVVIGPGLGRNQSMLGRISIIIEKVKSANVPLVIDADGLWHLTNTPGIIRGYTRAVLTPNAAEFARLAQCVLKRPLPPDTEENSVGNPNADLVREVAKALGGVTIVHKGCTDVVSDGRSTEKCVDEGCPRRCGGQGDLLSGSCAVFLHWSTRSKSVSEASGNPDSPAPGAGVLAGWAAARLSRACAAQAFSQHGRATTTTDLIGQIEPAFQRLYESETCL